MQSGRHARIPVQHLAEVADAERQVEILDDLAARVLDVLASQPVRDPGPDVVVAQQHPAPHPVARADRCDRRPQLLLRPLADREDAGRRLAALVERRIDERYAAGCGPLEELPDRTRVHPDDRVDVAAGERRRGQRDQVVGLVGRVEYVEADHPPEDAPGLIALVGRELGAGDGRRPPEACGPADRHQQPDPEIGRRLHDPPGSAPCRLTTTRGDGP